ncbi:MAG: hypothetical protein ACFWTN_04600 [Clostridium sp.]
MNGIHAEKEQLNIVTYMKRKRYLITMDFLKE